MDQPQEVVEDEEHERAWDRVAAIDVAKASGVVCSRVPDEDRPGRRRARVWTVTATMSEVTALGDHLRCQGIEIVTIESTSVIRGSKGWSRTLPRSCRDGRVCDGRDKSGNDEGPSRHQLCGRLSAWQTVPG